MAIQFNLLPWREELRANRLKRNKTALISAAVLGALISFAYFGYEKMRLNNYENALALINGKNNDLGPKLIEKKKLDDLKTVLNNQIDAIEALQDDRPSVSHMVEELSVANNQQLFLSEFILEDGRVNIKGIAENDAEIADLMKQLRHSQWYKEPELIKIYSDQTFGGEIKGFEIVSQLLLPGSDKTNEGDSDGKKEK